jgi:hypothetical protein
MHNKNAGRTIYTRWYVVENEYDGGWTIFSRGPVSAMEHVVSLIPTQEIADHIVAIHNSWTGRQEVTNWDRLQGNT